ncbi:hypothetical protein BB561_001272 [Smittium simulii]|uniref:Uncharacterized protein n=1 Tax=Smittium simulii TaxID=133385 RepID=A0A2T9YVD2_9FUNG|nr:hypothetical protein BB561_001272 [Smittium simulii]
MNADTINDTAAVKSNIADYSKIIKDLNPATFQKTALDFIDEIIETNVDLTSSIKTGTAMVKGADSALLKSKLGQMLNFLIKTPTSFLRKLLNKVHDIISSESIKIAIKNSEEAGDQNKLNASLTFASNIDNAVIFLNSVKNSQDAELQKLLQPILQIVEDLPIESVRSIQDRIGDIGQNVKSQDLIKIVEDVKRYIGALDATEITKYKEAALNFLDSSISNEPALYKNDNFVTYLKDTLTVWADYFSNVTKDIIENTALKGTPKKKAANTDTIPSKVWKLVQIEDKPEPNLAKLILKLARKIYIADKILTVWASSIVLPVQIN